MKALRKSPSNVNTHKESILFDDHEEEKEEASD